MNRHGIVILATGVGIVVGSPAAVRRVIGLLHRSPSRRRVSIEIPILEPNWDWLREFIRDDPADNGDQA